MDVHAPLNTRTKIPGKTVNRLLPVDVVAAKRRRRQLERRWKNTKSEFDRVAYTAACHKTNTLITKSLRDYFAGKINDAGQNVRRRWSVIRALLDSTLPSELLSKTESETLCNSFHDFFYNKINNIKQSIVSRLAGRSRDPLESDAPYVGTVLTDLKPVSVDEVQQLISSMDVFPTGLLKSCVDTFAPLIARLARLSFDGSFSVEV